MMLPIPVPSEEYQTTLISTHNAAPVSHVNKLITIFPSWSNSAVFLPTKTPVIHSFNVPKLQWYQQSATEVHVIVGLDRAEDDQLYDLIFPLRVKSFIETGVKIFLTSYLLQCWLNDFQMGPTWQNPYCVSYLTEEVVPGS